MAHKWQSRNSSPGHSPSHDALCHKEPIPPSRPQLGGSGAFQGKKRDRKERQDEEGEGFWKGKNQLWRSTFHRLCSSVTQQGPSLHCFVGTWWVKWQDPRDLSLVLHKLRSLHCVRKWKLQPPRLLSSTHADSQNVLPPGGAQGRLSH